MSPELIFAIIGSAANIIFLAGGFYFLVKQLRKDLSGMGIKLRSLDERSDDRHMVTAIAVILNTPAEKQRETAALFLNAGREKS
jgi:hypothetical protein